MEDEAKYYNAFNLIGEIGPIRFKKLAFYFKNLENAWRASACELEQSGISKRISDKIASLRPKISPDREWEKLATEQITAITINSEKYPKLLKETYDPPAILYIKGQLEEALDIPLAVVGSRKVSSYGIQVIKDIVGALARSGVSIVSGMAYGVDTVAHETAIQNGAKTAAVLASGLDSYNLSPRKQIAEKIIANGALISEYPFGKPARKHHFPIRDRIIAGLAPAVLVIEAREKSGALITPRLALEANRDVFAVPGGIYSPGSIGTNNLIKQGAKAITSYQEILDELNLTKNGNCINNKKIALQDQEEKKILETITSEPLHMDEISKRAKLPPERTASILMMMEIKRIVKSLGAGVYVEVK